jgi:hypothetical protein
VRFLEKFPESDRRALATSRLVALGGTPPAAREVVSTGPATVEAE